MKQIISIPITGGELSFKLPEQWEVIEARYNNAHKITSKDLQKAFLNPIKTERINELASESKSVAVIVDDHTRPTPAWKLIPHVLNELKDRLLPSNIKFIIASGAHRSSTHEEIVKKLGKNVVRNFDVICHNPYRYLKKAGKSPRGIPIYVNKAVLESDLKIGIGSIILNPSVTSGFGGGTKIIVPGVCGIDTIYKWHRLPLNVNRNEADEISKIVGLDIIVNVVIDGSKNIAGVVVGHPIEAWKQGVEIAKNTYRCDVSEENEIVIIGAYPSDLDIFQCGKVLDTAFGLIKPHGTVVLVAGCPEGYGYHGLLQKEGGKLWSSLRSTTKEMMKTKNLLICSQNLSEFHIEKRFPDAKLCKSPDQAVEYLTNMYGKNAQVAIIPYGPLSYISVKDK
ncbi:MAG: lactate racemase domain-containing protein [Candidatus Baldrarchaeia archaeon]